MSLRVARRLAARAGRRCCVMDLRWLKPLNADFIAGMTERFDRVLVVDEGRRTGGIAEEIFTVLDEQGQPGLRKARVSASDCYIPLGAAANLVLASEDDIYAAASELLGVAEGSEN